MHDLDATNQTEHSVLFCLIFI